MKGKVSFYVVLLAILFSIALLVSGCGGGGGSGGDGGGGGGAPPPKVSSISGSVSGTIILAVNSAGEVVAIDETTGRTPDLDLYDPIGNESFSFTLDGIPENTEIRIYLISDGLIYPMYFDSNGGNGSPNNNVFITSGELAISFGHIDINDLVNSGKAVPQNNPVAFADIIAGTEDQEIPPGFFSLNTIGFSTTELIDAGLNAIANGAVLMARSYFATAVNNSNSQTNLGDAARFFYALTRVGAIVFETYSDGGAANMNQVGDILDGIGVDTSGSIRANFQSIAVKINEIAALPNNSPTGADIQNLISNTLITELEGAIGNLNAVSPTFNWVALLPDNSPIEFDYGDSLAVRAAFKVFLATHQFQDSYNLNADIDDVVNNQSTTTIQSFLLDNPNFLTLGTSQLDSFKSNARGAMVDIDGAIKEIQNEIDNQTDDAISFINVNPLDIAAFQHEVIELIDSIDSGLIINDNDGIPGPSVDDSVYNLNILVGGIDLRGNLPSFSGDVPGFFPDDTLGGFIEQREDSINEDFRDDMYNWLPDGIPDILQRY